MAGIDADLGPETSTYWTIGTDWRPKFIDGLRLSLTYYDIDLKDVLANPGGWPQDQWPLQSGPAPPRVCPLELVFLATVRFS